MEVLSLLAEGKPYSGIAGDLNVSYKTVVNLSSQLKQKLGAKTLPELIRTAVQLLSPPAIVTAPPALKRSKPVFPAHCQKCPVELDNGPETRVPKHRIIHAH